MRTDPMEQTGGQEGRDAVLSSQGAQQSAPLYGRSPALPSSSLLVDEDEDMQAAIALSLCQGENKEAAQDKTDRQHVAPSVLQDCPFIKSAPKPFDVSSFHSVMWDDAATTDNDKTRWIQQGIDLRGKTDSDINRAAPHERGLLEMHIQQEELAKVKQAEAICAAPPASDSMLMSIGSNHGPWGLTQHHGGPCGVLAAVQAELLRLLLFGSRNPLEYPTEISEDQVSSPRNRVVVDELVREALAMSIAIVIARATLMPSAVDKDPDTAVSDKKSARIVLPATDNDEQAYTGLTWDHLYPPEQSTAETCNLREYTISVPPLSNPSKRQKMDEPQPPTEWLLPREMRINQLANAISKFLLQAPPGQEEAPLEYYRKPGGVILLTMSLVASRGKDTIQSDMDDGMGSMFTSQFGHCSQELMNLLLTGQAVSNVFDNTLTPSGGLTCRGIQSRPVIGYLSQLEAMRYCEVGGYYKNPRFPIWVVGSQSHFSVLFGEPSCLKESKSDALLEKCRRAFKSIQGAEENGYIPTDSLKEVLDRLELHVGDDALYPVLCAMVEMGGAGIVLWDDFWKVASRLLTGATLESVLQREESGGSNDSVPPPLLLANGELDSEQDKKPAAKVDDPDKKPASRVTFQDTVQLDRQDAAIGATSFAAAGTPPSIQSDEEMARRLAEEWGVRHINSPPAAVAPVAAAAARPSSPMEMDAAMSADEKLARKLQAEAWEDMPASGAASVDAVTDSPPPPLEGELKGEFILDTPEKEKAALQLLLQEDCKMPAVTRKLDFETFGNSFRLFHYNGLRGGSLTPFRVTRLTADEAVGTSVPLTNSTGAAGEGPGAASGDLEDVLRTKWPSCSIDWMGSSSPSID